MEEIAKGVNNIGFTEFILNQSHNMGKIRLSNVLTISNMSHVHEVLIDDRGQTETKTSDALNDYIAKSHAIT